MCRQFPLDFQENEHIFAKNNITIFLLPNSRILNTSVNNAGHLKKNRICTVCGHAILLRMLFLLSSDIRSEGRIAFVKDSTSIFV